ncbi:outer membrane protein [Spongiibacter sp. IMCC21906]|uniref:TolC family protein n=1 Tax=Spongiibacter sp. IMCC21906 TaxID=1620392 RepID=UPI00062E0953|nr:TolC family protein [Spongiibacter sp. IMCC21906]AKH69627.1 outer membrane protein [Spongiibacter sp. IMCC21906]
MLIKKPCGQVLPRLLIWLLPTVWLCIASVANATEATLSLAEASERTRLNNPDLDIFQWRFKALEGHRQRAALSPGYELGIEAENMLGTGPFSATDRADITVSIASVIELGDKRNARVSTANSRYALMEAQHKAAGLDILGQVTQRYIATLAVQEKLNVMKEARDLAKTTVKLVSHRVDRGASPEAERLRAKATLSQANLRLTAMQAELESRKLTLAILWGATSANFSRLSGELFQFQTPADFAELYQRATASPAIQVYASQARLRDAEIELARSQSSSNVRWSVGIRHFEDSGESAMVAGISVPLFTGSRSQGDVQSARAKRERLNAEKNSALLALRARLFEAWQTHQQSAAAARQIRNEVIPALQTALKQTRQAYDQGRYSYLDWLSVRRELLDARLASIDAASTALLNQALIEQLTAEPLASAATTASAATKPATAQDSK